MTAPHTTRPHVAPLAYAPHTLDAVRDSVRDVVREGGALLDAAADGLRRGPVDPTMAALMMGLRGIYDTLPAEVWRAFADEVCRPHPVLALVHQDPFTRRAFEKPRGYPGDAGILDLMYGDVAPPPETTPLGRAIHAHAVQSPASRSVRERRTLLVDAIDAAAARTGGEARILSVACGHLREAQRASAVRDGGVASFHALDQDPISIELLHAEHAPLGITPVLGSVKDLLTRRITVRDRTLTYAAGLYDYLPTPIAARLTARLFDTLAPGGRLLVANFCPETPDIGYMEALMDWRLIYRTERDMDDVAAEVPAERIASRRVYRDGGGNVVYLEIERD